VLLLATLAWLPVVLGAAAEGRLFGDAVAEPLLQHYAIHTRCLIGIPLLVAAEALAERAFPALVAEFVRAPLVPAERLASFHAVLADAARIRDSRWGSALVASVPVLVIASGFLTPAGADEFGWAQVSTDAGRARLTFAGGWYLFVARPLFAMLAAQWLWRIRVLFALFARIARLELTLPASHPDRAAGLGFLDQVPQPLAPVVFAFSAVIASRLAHDVRFHELRVLSIRPLALVWVVFAVVLCVLPLIPLALRLVRKRRAALLEYGVLLGRHAQLFEQRWLGGRAGGGSDDSQLGTADVSASADALAVYQAVENLRPLPIPLRGLAPVALAAALPFVPVFALEVPLQDLLKRILSALV
jgi:hypothetical protein